MNYLTTTFICALPVDSSKLDRTQTGIQTVKVVIPKGAKPKVEIPEGFEIVEMRLEKEDHFVDFYQVDLRVENNEWTYFKRESRYPMSPSQKGAPIPSYPSQQDWRDKAFAKYRVK